MSARTGVEVAAAGWVLAAGYALGRYRPIERAREWAIDELVFRSETTKTRALAALTTAMVLDPIRHRDIWANVLTGGRRPLPEPPKLAPAPLVRPFGPNTAEARRKQEEAAGRPVTSIEQMLGEIERGERP